MKYLIAAGALITALLSGMQAQAQDAAPAPSPTPLAGFSSHGTLAVDANAMGSAMSLTAEVAVWAKSGRVRLDILKFALAGAQGQTSTISQFLPTGAISIVYEQRTRTTTFWSEAKREYYQMKTTPTPKAKATAAPKSTEPEESPMDQILKVTRSVTNYDAFNETLSLVGHQPVNGHTSSLFHITLQMQQHGGKLRDVSGDMAFADDLSGIPVRLWITSKGEFDGSVKLDLLSATTDVPDPSVFKVPAGYKKVASMMELFAKSP